MSQRTKNVGIGITFVAVISAITLGVVQGVEFKDLTNFTFGEVKEEIAMNDTASNDRDAVLQTNIDTVNANLADAKDSLEAMIADTNADVSSLNDALEFAIQTSDAADAALAEAILKGDAQNAAELAKAKAEVQAVIVALGDAIADAIDVVQADLDATKADLAMTDADLDNTKNALDATSDLLDKTRMALNETTNVLADTKADYSNFKSETMTAFSVLSQKELKKLNKELDRKIRKLDFRTATNNKQIDRQLKSVDKKKAKMKTQTIDGWFYQVDVAKAKSKLEARQIKAVNRVLKRIAKDQARIDQAKAQLEATKAAIDAVTIKA